MNFHRNTRNSAHTKIQTKNRSNSDLHGTSAAGGVSGDPAKEAQACDEAKLTFKFFG